MLGFGALNAVSTEDSSVSTFHEVRKEEQEAEALALYNKALEYEKNNETKQAEEHFLIVLRKELIVQAPESLNEDEQLLQHPALFLKYNVLKHLANLKEKEDDKEKVLDYLLEAAVVDESDVSLWWKIGQFATSTLNIRLARYAFEKGLLYSPNHCLCLDQLITVLYVVGDYTACLEMISKAFDRDESYTKGFAIRDQIFKEEPCFKKDCISLRSLYIQDPGKDEAEYQSYIEEALVIRGKRQLLAKREELPKVKFAKPLQYYMWHCLGESLLQLYSELTDPNKKQSLCWSVDLSKYHRSAEQQSCLAIPSPDVLSKKYLKNTLKDGDNKGIKRKKLVLCSQDKNEPQPKRRSTRVKTSKVKDADVNWSDLVYNFLPPTFRNAFAMDTDDSQDSKVDIIEKPARETYWGSPEEIKKESLLVSNFINKQIKNGGCVQIVENLLLTLSEFWEQKWRSSLVEIYLPLYEIFCKHTCFPNALSSDNDENYMAKLGKVILMALEFQLDSLMLPNSSSSLVSSPSLSPFKSNMLSKLSKEGLTKFLSDLHYVSMLGAMNNILSHPKNQFKVRFYWVQGRYCMMQNEIYPATNALNNCAHVLLSYSSNEITLHNCKHENIISEETVDKKIDSVQQSQSLEELQELLDKQKHSEIISILESLIEPSNKNCDVKLSPERPSQLLLLQESYFLSNKYQQCLDCTVTALNEVFLTATATETWKIHLNKLLKCLDDCMSCKQCEMLITTQLMQSLSDKMIKLIELSMDCDSAETEFVTTLPWLITYRIMQMQYSQKDVEIDVSTSEHSKESCTGENSPLEFLKNAHEYLGRKHWCCHDDGILLQQFIKDSLYELSRTSQREDILKNLEQCFYCLYGNPCKKTKTKSIQEHNDQPIKLTWDNAKVLYDFYKPTGLPQFDLKPFTISVEVQNVLRKICSVVPQQDIEVIPFETLQHYIDGGEDLPIPDHNLQNGKSTGMEDLFYYLGDFYFKNKEFNKALKFYMHDVCIKPTRFQSWAAMALTRGSRLEEKINQCELKSDGPMKKHITATLRCYEKAVALCNEKCLVLEEYGQTTYMLNSYAARKLLEGIQDEKHDVQLLESYRTMQKQMLVLSEKCFTDALKAASLKEGERWLHYYMLGKIAEKLQKPASSYLDYYQKSLEELYQSGAHYLKRISYHGPPEYSIEAVELFYRIHASILKILKYSETIDYDLLEKHLERAVNQIIYVEIVEVDKLTLKENDVSSSAAAKGKVTVIPEESIVSDVVKTLIDLVSKNVEEQNVNGPKQQGTVENRFVTLSQTRINSNTTKKVQGNLQPQQSSLPNIMSKKPRGFIVDKEVEQCLEVLVKSVCLKNVDFDVAIHETVQSKSTVSNGATSPPFTAVMTTSPQLNSSKESTTFVSLNTPKMSAKEGSMPLNLCDASKTPKYLSATCSPLSSVSSSAHYTTPSNVANRYSSTSTGWLCTRDVSTAVTSTLSSYANPLDSKSNISFENIVPKSTMSVSASNTNRSCCLTKYMHDASTSMIAIATTGVCVNQGEQDESNSFKSRECSTSSSSTDYSKLQLPTTERLNKTLIQDKSIPFSVLPKTIIDLTGNTQNVNKTALNNQVGVKKQTNALPGNLELSGKTEKDAVTTEANVIIEVQSALDDVVAKVEAEISKTLLDSKTASTYTVTASSSVGTVQNTNNTESDRSKESDKTSKHITKKEFNKRIFKNTAEETCYKATAEKCLAAFGFCIRRFPEHYKSQYQMSHFLAYSCLKNLQWSRDLLLGSTTSTKYFVPLPSHGIFSGKKKTNLFQYLWRIPVNEIDRPGSFCTHIRRGIELMLDVLFELKDNHLLLHISAFLHKTPDKDKKYLRDNDRAFLAIKAFDYVLETLKCKIKHVSGKEDLKQLVFEAHEIYKHSQKMQISVKTTEYLLIKAYVKYTSPQQEEDTKHLEEAIKFCQQTKFPL
ncbi:calcineurin-binding protein cabin-1-like [Hydractinia symbiolongicarpus]|uniref:calcineurin-binding protein cabin-1-like n=1 Tax=Hydractinia symbiolongicarpus TaxID=13093 RepID=UPI00254E1C26|nr:calcineurin-binding protein cabin-1-like [Hydractinia symbiolongicarpus]XP_057289692.1 calcineurin-binding protein cabin-1-like [Hydractinia symbiolongicarpus]